MAPNIVWVSCSSSSVDIAKSNFEEDGQEPTITIDGGGQLQIEKPSKFEDASATILGGKPSASPQQHCGNSNTVPEPSSEVDSKLFESIGFLRMVALAEASSDDEERELDEEDVDNLCGAQVHARATLLWQRLRGFDLAVPPPGYRDPDILQTFRRDLQSDPHPHHLGRPPRVE